jgi:putative ABC transport system permease protein
MHCLLRRHLGYLTLSTFVLAVSTGANLVVFTVVNALWVRPLPFPEPERVVTIPGSMSFGPTHLHRPVFQMFEGGVAGQVVTNDMFPWQRLPWIEIAGQNLETLAVTSGYFSVLRLAIRGRDFSPDDERDGAEPVAIISHRWWSSAFGQRSDAIGALLPSKPLPIRIVGVAPSGFNGARRGEQVDVWIPVSVGRRIVPSDGATTLLVLARLGPTQSTAEMTQRIEAVWPDLFRLFQTNLTPLNNVFGSPETPTFVIRESNAFLLAAALAVLVLLSGCATVAALVLMHYERRRGELALKMSLGASRARLVLELARELTLVAAAGSSAGLLVAFLGVQIVGALSLPGGVEIGRLNLSIDWRVCAVGVAATALTLVIAAALPIARTTHLRIAGELLMSPSTATLGSLRVRQVLLAFQVSTTIVVLVAAGLFVRAVLHGFGRAAGFDVDRTVFVSVPHKPPDNPVPDLERGRVMRAERTERVMSVVRALPGVSDVAQGISPIGPDAERTGRRSLTVKVGDRERKLWIDRLAGSPGLLSVLGVSILAGRSLTDGDLTGSPLPAVITQSLAARLWPDGGALGEAFRITELRGGSYQVVGICQDFAFGSLAQPGSGVVVTARPGLLPGTKLVVRTEHPETVAGTVRRSIEGAGVRIATGKDVIARDMGRQRLGAWVFSGFGLAALLLGVGGTFGLVAYLAESRRRDFGVRLALGADLHDLVRYGIGVALAPVSVGVAAGLGFGALISQVFEALLAGISAIDVLTYLAVAATMLGCATIAGLAAAWRLRHTTPSDALRAT